MTCVQRNPRRLQASTGTRTAVHQLPSLLAFRSASFPQSSSLSAVWQMLVTSMPALCLCLSVCASLPLLSFSLPPSSVRPSGKGIAGSAIQMLRLSISSFPLWWLFHKSFGFPPPRSSYINLRCHCTLFDAHHHNWTWLNLPLKSYRTQDRDRASLGMFPLESQWDFTAAKSFRDLQRQVLDKKGSWVTWARGSLPTLVWQQGHLHRPKLSLFIVGHSWVFGAVEGPEFIHSA